MPADDLPVLVVLLEPAPGLLVVGHRLRALPVRKLVDALHRAAEQQNVFHAQTSITSDERRAARSTRSGTGELWLLLGEEGHDADRRVGAQRSPREVLGLDRQRLVE